MSSHVSAFNRYLEAIEDVVNRKICTYFTYNILMSLYVEHVGEGGRKGEGEKRGETLQSLSKESRQYLRDLIISLGRLHPQ